MVEVEIESPLTKGPRRFQPTDTWDRACGILELVTGVERQQQQITCENPGEAPRAIIPADMSLTLAQWGIQEGAKITVESKGASVVDAIQTEHHTDRFVLSEDAYNARPNSVRQWKRELGVDNAASGAPGTTGTTQAPSPLAVGDRAFVAGKGPCTVRFVGPVAELGGRVFLGVEWDSALGKNDGMLGASRYFTCAALHGSFVPPPRAERADRPDLIKIQVATQDEI